MNVKPGMRLRSAVDATEVVVVHASHGAVDLRCGGHPMAPIPGETPPAGLEPTDLGGTLLGKRYEHAASGLELLVTKAGVGGLSVDGESVPIKASKPLPSSD